MLLYKDKYMSYNDIKSEQSYYYNSNVDSVEHYYYVVKKDSSGIKYIHMSIVNKYILIKFSYSVFEGTSEKFLRSFENLPMATETSNRQFIQAIFDAQVI
jgi:hypothetical protein